MSSKTESSWWDLHLKYARGEPLSTEEQQQYEAVLAQHDREDSTHINLELMKWYYERNIILAQEQVKLIAQLQEFRNSV